FFRLEAAIGRRPDDDAAARETLADIVVGVALELEGHAAREPGAEALAGGAVQAYVDGAGGQAGGAEALGDFARNDGAGGAVGVPDLAVDPHLGAALDRVFRLRDQPAVENVADLVVLLLAIVNGDAGGRFRLEEQAREIEALRLPVLDHLALVEHLHL